MLHCEPKKGQKWYFAGGGGAGGDVIYEIFMYIPSYIIFGDERKTAVSIHPSIRQCSFLHFFCPNNKPKKKTKRKPAKKKKKETGQSFFQEKLHPDSWAVKRRVKVLKKRRKSISGGIFPYFCVHMSTVCVSTYMCNIGSMQNFTFPPFFARFNACIFIEIHT